MYRNQFVKMKRMHFVTANGSVCVRVYNKLKPLNIEAARVASARLRHAVSWFTGQAVGGLITLWPYMADWRHAKSRIRIRLMTAAHN